MRVARVKEAVRPHVLTLCRQWLPGGKVVGRWYMVRSPFRDERTPSFGVCISDGGYWDFGKGEGGDIIDLCVKLHRVSIQDALEAFEQMLGIDNRDQQGSSGKSERRSAG